MLSNADTGAYTGVIALLAAYMPSIARCDLLPLMSRTRWPVRVYRRLHFAAFGATTIHDWLA